MKREDVLEAAKQCVCGDKDHQYGLPENNFASIAQLWTTYLQKSGFQGSEYPLDATDVAAMMILFKVGRISTGYEKADNWIDIAGYAACGAEIGKNER